MKNWIKSLLVTILGSLLVAVFLFGVVHYRQETIYVSLVLLLLIVLWVGKQEFDREDKKKNICQPFIIPKDHIGVKTIKEIQVKLPWTIKYSTDFRSNPMSHKDFAHGLTHVGKAAGKLHEFVDNMDHDRDTALGFGGNKEEYAKYIADLVICALRMANTFPGGVIDLETEVIKRIESKNGVKL